MTSKLSQDLQIFVDFCQKHIKGDEKSEAQTFLDRFFRAFGHEGAMEAGAVYEQRVKKGSKTGKTGFADLVWKPRVLIEMKKRGTDLNKHYSQAFDYWIRLVPDRPRYVLLCNFDEFWVYDFEIQLDTPIDVIPLLQLPQQQNAFGFMEWSNRTPIFRNNQVEVTERAARRMGELLYELETRGIDKLIAQRFILQCVLAMFSEDRGLLPSGMFIECVKACLQGESSYDVLNALFQEMNRKGKTPAGRYKDVDYFNGGLFAEIYPIELTEQELKMLEVSALEDWSKIRPAIFGNLFESAIDEKQRHDHGIHFTSEVDIMKIVRPTISRYWEEKIENSKTISELENLQLELQSYRVLDPACGSGNFLYIAYQELKRIEQLLLDRIAERRKSPREQIQMGFITPMQFYGIDNNPFAVELARVTMMISRKVAIDKFCLSEPALPLDTLDQNIVCNDALFTEWPEVNAIIGNPPFLGRGKTKSLNELNPNYKKDLHKIYQSASFPRSADLCCYWFRKSHDSTATRIGLVGSNSITQGSSRKASLEFIARNNGFIYDAISSQIWSGEAKVYVSIVNWSKEPQAILHLDDVCVTSINSSLKSEIDATICKKLRANLGICFQGVVPQPLERYLISQETALLWFKKDSKNKNVVKRLLSADELTDTVDFASDRFLIDFNKMTIEEASTYDLPFNFVKNSYLISPDKNNEDHKNWWQLWRPRMGMKLAITSLKEYIAMPGHSKWFIPVIVPVEYLAYVNSSFVIASDDYYLLGILTSSFHRNWVEAQSSSIKVDTRYTNTTCFETFPFPQFTSQKLAKQICQTSLDLYEYRSQKMQERKWGITKLYNEFFHEPSSQLAKLHSKLDELVMQAYGFTNQDDILEKLLELNLDLAEKENRGESIVGPWAPD
jgi:SAM-dependent methyltransferase